MNEKLEGYITKARQAGLGNEEIRKNLLKAGWSEPLIDEVLIAGAALSVPAPELPGVMDLLKRTFQIFRVHWKTFITILSFPYIILFLTQIAYLLIFPAQNSGQVNQQS